MESTPCLSQSEYHPMVFNIWQLCSLIKWLIDLYHWKWHILSLANTLEGHHHLNHMQITSIFSVVSGAWDCIVYTVEWRWWLSYQFALLGYCISSEFLPFLPRRKVFFPVKTHFFPLEGKKYFPSRKPNPEPSAYRWLPAPC